MRFSHCTVHGTGDFMHCTTAQGCEWVVQKEEKMAITNVDNEIENWFTYHAPNPAQQAQYEQLREKAKEMAYLIRQVTPKSADQTASLRKLRECVMTANAAISCGGK